jgi:hypothetical protein
MAEFASRWPDARLWAIDLLTTDPVVVLVSAERDNSLDQQLVVSAVWQGLETAASRACLVTVEGWDSASKKAAYDLTADAAYRVESAPRDGKPIVKAGINTGPDEVRDPQTGTYNYEAVVLVTFHRLQ